jgi:hypothetical protein
MIFFPKFFNKIPAMSLTGKRKEESTHQPNIHTWTKMDVVHTTEEMQLHMLTKLLDTILSQSREAMNISSKLNNFQT